jgi:hypothetical protein
MTTSEMENDFFVDEEEIEGSYEQEAEDLFSVGSEATVRLSYANGYQRNLVNKFGQVTPVTAAGWIIDVSKAPEDLIDALVVMHKKGLVTPAKIKHSTGKIVEYYMFSRKTGEDEFGNPTFDRNVRMIPLIHNVPGKNSIAKSVANQNGLVYGTYTDYDDNTKKHTTGGYCGCMVILPDLYEAGYRGENGEAKPIVIRVKGSSSKEFYNAITEHGMFIKAMRDKMTRDLLAEKTPDREVKKQVSRRVNMFTYVMTLSPSDETNTHGQEGESQEVFEIVNRRIGYDDLDRAYEGLFCSTGLNSVHGKKLYNAILPLVYDKPVKGQPLTAGGDAVKWCRDHMAYYEGLQDIWNPNRDLKYKSRQDAPVWMINIAAKLKAGTFDAANNHPATSTTAPAAATVDESQGMVETVKALGNSFEADANLEGLALVKEFIEIYEADDATRNPELFDLYSKINILKPRARRKF